MTTSQKQMLVREAQAPYGAGPLGQSDRLAGFMGLKRRKSLDPLGLADLVSAGLPLRSADHMDRLLAAGGVLAHPGGRPIHALISEPTLRRARTKKQPLSCQASERIYDMARVLDVLLRMFHERAAALAFLDRPHPLLDGRRPFEVVCSSTAGANAVIELLEQAEASVAV